MKEKNFLRYLWVTILNIVITLAEFIGGIMSGSLALISDAIHNLSDVGAIILAFIANLISKRKKNDIKTFGYERAEILAAFVNGLVLFLISIYLLIEGILRFSNPTAIEGKVMLIISTIGLIANVISMLTMAKDARNNLNAKATFLNMLSDALSNVAVVVSAIIISIWKVYWIDPVLTIGASIFLLKEAYSVTIKAASILMESNPGIDLNQVKDIILSAKEINSVHDVHIWQYSNSKTMLMAHVNVKKKTDADDLNKAYSDLKKELQKIGIEHITLQTEY